MNRLRTGTAAVLCAIWLTGCASSAMGTPDVEDTDATAPADQVTPPPRDGNVIVDVIGQPNDVANPPDAMNTLDVVTPPSDGGPPRMDATADVFIVDSLPRDGSTPPDTRADAAAVDVPP